MSAVLKNDLGIGYSIRKQALYENNDPEFNRKPLPMLCRIGEGERHHLVTTSRVGGEGSGANEKYLELN